MLALDVKDHLFSPWSGAQARLTAKRSQLPLDVERHVSICTGDFNAKKKTNEGEPKNENRKTNNRKVENTVFSLSLVPPRTT
jgi:hypothetical protein